MRTLIAFILALNLARAASAGAAGAEPFSFLLLDANSRAVALSGAYTALAADANALLYNPAGLGRISANQATFMHNEYFQGITQEYVAFASPKGWGVNFNYLDFGDVKNTTLSNQTGAGLGSVGVTDLAISAGYGRALTANLAAGAGLKFIKETIDDVTGQGLALDLGLMYTAPMVKGLTLAAAAQNLGPTVRFQKDEEKLPLNLRAGAAYAFTAAGLPVTFEADLTKERSQNVLAAFGLEAVVAKSFPVRLGYNGRTDDGPGITAGLGYLYRNFSFDYAFAPFKKLGAAHRLSVTLQWGK